MSVLDDPDTHVLLGCEGVVTYGTHADADLRIENVVVTRDTTDFDVIWRGDRLGAYRHGGRTRAAAGE